MPADPSTTFGRRIVAARRSLATVPVQALVVTHLPNLRYLTGFSGSAGAVLLTDSRCILVVDFRYAAAATEIIAANGNGIELHVVSRSYDEDLARLLRETGAPRIGVEGASMPVARFNRLAKLLTTEPAMLDMDRPSAVLVPTERIIERGRLVKDEAEVTTLRTAARLLSQVARGVPPFVRVGRSEQEVAWDIDASLRRAGFERPAFETIVASGPNSARPHARPGRRRLQRDEPVVLDFGGVYDGYCVDLTRTVFMGGADVALRRMFDAVAEARQAALAAVRPGAMPPDVDAAARRVLEQHGLGEAFGHGTGHGLGLEVHEEPRIGKPVAGLADAPLAAGTVFTIEPGAYVEGIGGVRIEDDVLVVEGGCELLTDVPIEFGTDAGS
jgi:Xaa-Pro aminopeptidase